MKIDEWFDPHNIDHLKAYNHLRNYGEWPRDFLPDDLEYVFSWQMILMSKIANAYILEKLS